MKNLLPLNTEVCVSIMSGFIKSARRDCKAGPVGRCSHVAAVLLMLSNYILENGHVAEKHQLHCLVLGIKEKSETKPQENFMSQFMNPVSENKDKFSMWETLMKVTYEDFMLDDDDKLYYKYLVRHFKSCLHDNVANIFENSFSGQVPGYKEQSNSETWLQERYFRITDSVCKNVVLIGEKIKKNVDAKHQCFGWIRNHSWFPNLFKTLDTKYGIENESKAIAINSSQTDNKVVSSGLWINAKY